MADWNTTKFETSAETKDAGLIHCYDCKKKTRHDILASVYEESETENGDAISNGTPEHWEMWNHTNYEIIRCRGCEQIVFRTRNRFSENTEITPIDDGFGGRDYIDLPIESIHIYPRKVGGISFLDSRFLPEKLKKIHNETCSAIAYDNRVLAGIGLRAILETVCKDKGAAGRRLVDQIDDLVTKGFLSLKSAEIMHKIRFLGNKAAHEVEPESSENISLALEIIENLLRENYILAGKAAALPSP